MGRGTEKKASNLLYGPVEPRGSGEILDISPGPLLTVLEGFGDNTSFTYRYRDADNYKTATQLILPGKPHQEEVDEIQKKLIDGDSFIAEQVGLEPLQDDLRQWDTANTELDEDGHNQADHCWHEIDTASDIQPTTEAPTTDMTFEELVSRFTEVQTWDEAQSSF